MVLSYGHPSDFTLEQRIGGVRTGSLAEAAQALNAIYSPYGVAIALDSGQILVRQVEAGRPLATDVEGVEASKVP